MTTAQVILQQIRATTPINVFFSWGISKISETTYKGMQTLVLKVNGFQHKGLVYITLNEGADLYEITLFKIDWQIKKHLTDVYCEDLGMLLDSLIERPESQSDADYLKKVESAKYRL